jgi:putative redox protein
MKISLSRINEALAFEAKNEEGQSIKIDASPSVGGEGLGMRPMEILASALASCASIDVLLILKKKRIQVNHYQVFIEAKRKDAVPAPFETINLIFEVDENCPLTALEQAVALSVEKYCSVSASLSKEVEISFECRIKA